MRNLETFCFHRCSKINKNSEVSNAKLGKVVLTFGLAMNEIGQLSDDFLAFLKTNEEQSEGLRFCEESAQVVSVRSKKRWCSGPVMILLWIKHGCNWMWGIEVKVFSQQLVGWVNERHSAILIKVGNFADYRWKIACNRSFISDLVWLRVGNAR